MINSATKKLDLSQENKQITPQIILIPLINTFRQTSSSFNSPQSDKNKWDWKKITEKTSKNNLTFDGSEMQTLITIVGYPLLFRNQQPNDHESVFNCSPNDDIGKNLVHEKYNLEEYAKLLSPHQPSESNIKIFEIID